MPVLTYPAAVARMLQSVSTPLKRRVLLVDDNPEVRRALSRQVQLLGYAADVAGTGAKALAMAAAHEYDVVVTDLLMPELNGMELMTALTQRSATTSFVLMTGARDLGDHHSPAIDVRLTTVLTKPLAERELADALARAFEVSDTRRSLFSPGTRCTRALSVEDSTSDAFLIDRSLRASGRGGTTSATHC